MNRLMRLFLMALVFGATNVSAGTIQPGQMIKIVIVGVSPQEASRVNNNYSVDDSGYVQMWKIGRLKASGLTSASLARKIESAYRQAEIYTSPTIQIFTDSGDILVQEQVTIGGKVRSPGAKPFQAGMTLFDAVMAAGGPTDFGAINRVKLYRNGKVYTYDLKKAEHKLLKMYPRDTIDVPAVNWRGH
jgi:protein involved in polysaccharide export with SLBB domain